MPSYSQLNARFSTTDKITAAADPYATPIIITALLQGGPFRVDLELKREFWLHACSEVAADPGTRCVVCVLACR